jgi:hypothetical protein
MADPRFHTRAVLVTPDPATVEGRRPVKKEALRIVNRHRISLLALRCRKMTRDGQFRLVLQSQNNLKIDAFISALTNDHATWEVVEVDVTPDERETFSGVGIHPTPQGLSGGPGSSGEEQSGSSIDTGSTASARAVREAEARAARAEAELQAERQRAEAELQAERQRAERAEAKLAEMEAAFAKLSAK